MIEIFRKSWEETLLKWRDQLVIQRRWYLIKTLKGEQEVGVGRGHCNQRHQHKQRYRGMKVPEDSAIKQKGGGRHNQSCWGE